MRYNPMTARLCWALDHRWTPSRVGTVLGFGDFAAIIIAIRWRQSSLHKGLVYEIPEVHWRFPSAAHGKRYFSWRYAVRQNENKQQTAVASGGGRWGAYISTTSHTQWVYHSGCVAVNFSHRETHLPGTPSFCGAGGILPNGQFCVFLFSFLYGYDRDASDKMGYQCGGCWCCSLTSMCPSTACWGKFSVVLFLCVVVPVGTDEWDLQSVLVCWMVVKKWDFLCMWYR